MADRTHWAHALTNILMAWKGGDILQIYNAVCNNRLALLEMENYFSQPVPEGVGLTEEEKAFLNALTEDLKQ